MPRLLAEEAELLAQMRACEGLIAQGRRRIEASQIRSQEISRSVEEVTLTLTLTLTLALALAPAPAPAPAPALAFSLPLSLTRWRRRMASSRSRRS